MADRTLTDLELERWLADDLPEARRRAATDADRTRLDELRAEHAGFLAGVDVPAEVRAIRHRAAPPARPRRSALQRWFVPGAALAAAAAAVIVIVRPAPDDDLRTKGDTVGLVVHIATASGSRRLATGDTVHPGDRIRFEASVPRRGYVAVIGIDATGTSTVYYPATGSDPAAIEPRTGDVLPGAIALDATPGDERFYLVYGEQPFSISPLLVAGLRGDGTLRGLSTAQVVLHKQPGP